MARQTFRFKIEKKQALVFATIFGIIALGVAAYIIYATWFAPVIVAEFEGVPVAFRADLRQAQKIEVFPNETAVTSLLAVPTRTLENQTIILRPPVRNVTIAFNSQGVSPDRLGWYSVEVAEVVNKLTGFYKLKFGRDISFRVIETNDYSALEGRRSAPIVALVHPDIADGTFVSVDSDRRVVTISGGDTLRDFDLATVKFMMVALGIEVR